MSDQASSSAAHPSVQLEIVPEDLQQQDLGDVAERSQNIIDYLHKNGCKVTPAYTGKMGGPLYDLVVYSYQIIHSNEELLAALFASVAATLKLINEHNKREKQENTGLTPAPLPVEIDLPTKDGPITLKAPDAETAVKMLEQLQMKHPEKIRKVTPQGKATIKVSIPRQKWHRQRS
jgi:hypothetical protein